MTSGRVCSGKCALFGRFPDSDVGTLRFLDMGPVFGIIFAIMLVVDCLFFMFLEWWLPEDSLDKVQMHWSHTNFQRVCDILLSSPLDDSTLIVCTGD